MMRLAVIILFLLWAPSVFAGKVSLGIMKYQGGDWYSVKGAVKHFIGKVQELTPLKLKRDPVIVSLRDRTALFNQPFLILNGHGQIILDDVEKNNLKDYLAHGGFLLVNDDYGLDRAFRSLIKDMYGDNSLVGLSSDFPLFRSYYTFKNLPKVHKHDGLPPKAYGLFIEKRLVLLYLNNSDIADGWEPEAVHKDPPEVREKAIRFGINILYYVLSH